MVLLLLLSAMIVIGICAAAFPSTTHRDRVASDRCLKCGYPVDGLGEDAPCPECGTEAARSRYREIRRVEWEFEARSMWKAAAAATLPVAGMIMCPAVWAWWYVDDGYSLSTAVLMATGARGSMSAGIACGAIGAHFTLVFLLSLMIRRLLRRDWPLLVVSAVSVLMLVSLFRSLDRAWGSGEVHWAPLIWHL